MTYDVGNPGTGQCQAQKCGRIKPLNVALTLPLFNILSPTTMQILTNDKTPAQITSYSNKPQTIIKQNNNINMDSTIAGSMTAQLTEDKLGRQHLLIRALLVEILYISFRIMFIQRGTTKVSNHQSSMMKATKYTPTVFIFRKPVMQKSDPCNSPR